MLLLVMMVVFIDDDDDDNGVDDGDSLPGSYWRWDESNMLSIPIGTRRKRSYRGRKGHRPRVLELELSRLLC